MKKSSASQQIDASSSRKLAKPTSQQSSSAASSPPLPFSRARILLVDDDPGVRGSLGDALMSEGYIVIPADDGQQALELASSTPVDLVLLDLNMPRKNGWDTFEGLSARHPLAPIIIVTARPNQLFTAISAGVGALLEKPLDIPMLIRTIKRLLAESAEARLARLAGRETEFHYSAAQTQ